MLQCKREKADCLDDKHHLDIIFVKLCLDTVWFFDRHKHEPRDWGPKVRTCY